mmetsp:Transcript_48547/g.128096  ORF Transcript_48547/g.128096 Transcript_48547/m.128096 type:complete len:273 (-) Transcript_48547:185-1003(-)
MEGRLQSARPSPSAPSAGGWPPEWPREDVSATSAASSGATCGSESERPEAQLEVAELPRRSCLGEMHSPSVSRSHTERADSRSDSHADSRSSYDSRSDESERRRKPPPKKGRGPISPRDTPEPGRSGGVESSDRRSDQRDCRSTPQPRVHSDLARPLSGDASGGVARSAAAAPTSAAAAPGTRSSLEPARWSTAEEDERSDPLSNPQRLLPVRGGSSSSSFWSSESSESSLASWSEPSLSCPRADAPAWPQSVFRIWWSPATSDCRTSSQPW